MGSTASCCDRVAGTEMDGSDQLPHLHQDGGQRRGLLVGLGHDVVPVGIEHQLMNHADSQAAFHHRQYGVIVADLVADVRLLLEVVQELGDFVVLLLLQIDEVLVGQLSDGVAGIVGQGMVLRQNGHQSIL